MCWSFQNSRSWCKCLKMDGKKENWIQAWGLEPQVPEVTKAWMCLWASAAPALLQKGSRQRQESPWIVMGQLAWHTEQQMTREPVSKKVEDETEVASQRCVFFQPQMCNGTCVPTLTSTKTKNKKTKKKTQAVGRKYQLWPYDQLEKWGVYMSWEILSHFVKDMFVHVYTW